jgi:acyl-CoA synthetase (AMP-forming)/AMP-acid ligase II
MTQPFAKKIFFFPIHSDEKIEHLMLLSCSGTRIVSGTSPLSKHVAELLSVSLSVKISEGYGLTETCGAACFTVEDGSNTFVVGHVGPPLPCCEVKVSMLVPFAFKEKIHCGKKFIC